MVEGEPGDVARFAELTHPTHAVITGLAAAHLDEYKTVQAAGEDIFAVADYLNGKNVYVNDESPDVKPFLKASYKLFNEAWALGMESIAGVKTGLDGTAFTIKKGAQVAETYKVACSVGINWASWHLWRALALELGLSEKQIQAGIAKTKPFEHRMQPYQLAGAWVIDDTYNGNLEGIRAGTALLKELEAKRKIYVTPGLVDQGEETERVHREAGKLIAAAQPDLVVLMQNSVTGLYTSKDSKWPDSKANYGSNTIRWIFTPTSSISWPAGDLVVMQNDWTDNYA